jgi:hypothetical protein
MSFINQIPATLRGDRQAPVWPWFDCPEMKTPTHGVKRLQGFVLKVRQQPFRQQLSSFLPLPVDRIEDATS